MNHTRHTGRLVLTSRDPYLLPEEPETILKQLHEIGFVEHPLKNISGYQLGERFMQLVSFMGCSPYIRLQPDKSDEHFCYLRLDGPYPRPKLLHGKNTQPPRCKACRKRLSDWQTSFKSWKSSTDHWQARCPHCGYHQDPVTYDFRQSAGCGRLFLFVENIFPQEAIPSPALLEALKRVSKGEAWGYFYHQN